MRLLTSVLLAVAASLLVAGCVHRPYYRDLVGSAAGQKEIRVRITNGATGEPLANVPVSVGSAPMRVTAISDANGILVLPVKKQLLDPYTLVEVARPPGVERYDLERLSTESSTTDMAMDAGS
ncbi:MAG: hypothetical protein ACJ790_04290 [Myxococcaceae bacterium]